MEDNKKINISSNNNNNKRIRDESELSELPEAKRIRDSLLDESEFMFDDDSENDQEDLVSVMRSFEEEISLQLPPPEVEVEISSSSFSLCGGGGGGGGGGELIQPELLIGFLLEASDDELGLPPKSSSSSSSNDEGGVLGEINSGGGGGDDMLRVLSETVGFDDQIWGFEDEISRRSITTDFEFGIGIGEQEEKEKDSHRDFDELVNFEGLFDYSDGGVGDVLSLGGGGGDGISDFSDFSCRSEWLLPAL